MVPRQWWRLTSIPALPRARQRMVVPLAGSTTGSARHAERHKSRSHEGPQDPDPALDQPPVTLAGTVEITTSLSVHARRFHEREGLFVNPVRRGPGGRRR